MLTLGKAPQTGSHTHFPKTQLDQEPLPLHQTFMRMKSPLMKKQMRSVFSKMESESEMSVC